jgi:hypothetical protein
MDAVPPPIKYDETARTKIVKVVRLRKLPKELVGVEAACAIMDDGDDGEPGPLDVQL